MRLDRIIAVNWGQIPAGAYDLGDLTMLSGENGSGKSTLLDGLQSVLTGVHLGIVQFNPGQKETSEGGREKTKRSLEGYIVGADRNQFARPEGAHGYIACVFQPDAAETQCRPMTALVAASARVEGPTGNRQAKPEHFALYIIDGGEAVLEDFLPNVETGEVVPVEAIGRRLRDKYPKVVPFEQKKGDYLCALYGRFRGKTTVSRDEAMQAARAWVQSIAYRKIGSVNELVRDEILDFDEQQLKADIERISSLMKEVSNLRKEGARLQESVKQLDALEDVLAQTAAAHEAHVAQEVFAAKLRLRAEEAEEAGHRQRLDQTEKDKAQRVSLIAERTSRRDRLDADRTTLKAQMMGIPAQQQKQHQEGRIETATGKAKAVLTTLFDAMMAANHMDARAKALLKAPEIPGLARVNRALSAVGTAYAAANLAGLGEVAGRVLALQGATKLEPNALRDIVAGFADVSGASIEVLFTALAAPQDSLQVAVTQEAALHESVRSEAERKVRELQASKSLLSKGKVEYPRQVDFALTRIREQFPRANPQVLCDLVEPKSEEWQSAIEGYLGGARFNIVVLPASEKEVLNFVRSQNFGDVKVVQGKKCLDDVENLRLPADSIVHELSAANEIVWAFLASQFGPVVKVKTFEQLQNTSRGLMQDGRATGGRTYFVATAKTLVFGQKARQRQLQQVTEQLADAEERLLQVQSTEQRLKQLQQELGGLRAASFDAAPLVEHAAELDAAQRALDALDLTGLADMESRLTQLNDDIKELDEQNRRDERANGQADEQMKAANVALRDLMARRDGVLAAVQAQVKRLGELARVSPSLNYRELAGQVEERLKDTRTSVAAAYADASELGKRPFVLFSQSRDALGEYHHTCRNDERFVDALLFPGTNAAFDAAYEKVLTLRKAVGERLTALKSAGIYNNQLELERATHNFNDVFTKHFCLEIRTRVEDGVRTLRQLNNELRNMRFGQDCFTLDWSQWEPELLEYLEFFEAVTKLTEASEELDLFGENQLAAKHLEIRDRLKKLLLSDDQEQAMKELRRIADYRNYRRYDIISTTEGGAQVRLSQWGTGSGGQLETPAYIVRAAIVTNRLKIFEKGPSLRLLANDEAFTLMDETRARAVLRFMSENLNLQVISAMPTNKAGAIRDEFSREYIFTQVKPVQNGELDFMVDCHEVVYKKDKMRDLWERAKHVAREKAKQLFELENPAETAAAAGTADAFDTAK